MGFSILPRNKLCSPTARLAMGFLAQNSSGRSGAAATPGSGEGFGGFRCRLLMRFRRVPGQMADEVPESSGADPYSLQFGLA